MNKIRDSSTNLIDMDSEDEELPKRQSQLNSSNESSNDLKYLKKRK